MIMYVMLCLVCVVAGGGSSLLATPSAALRRLVGGAVGGAVSAFEAPRVDPAALTQRPVLAFVLARRDLHAYTQKLDGAVRINTVRQYAFEVRTFNHSIPTYYLISFELMS